MENLEIYQNIASRTDGDIYVGVVGPVRTGKSTFIKKFMELLVLPNIENAYKKERAIDELPQSASGRTIMTTEPKFIPNEAVEITIGDNLKLKARLVDCVGYLVNNALGYLENDVPRMVKTPWSNEEMPFELAAEIGTKKVIEEHSTIGVLVTTDGTITDIARADYIEAEERVVRELKAINKPFLIILNSSEPYSDYTMELSKKLEEKYGVSVLPTDCANMTLEDMNGIFSRILYEFPVDRININFPRWVEGLSEEHWLKKQLYSEIKENLGSIRKIKEFRRGIGGMSNSDIVVGVDLKEIQLGNGSITLTINLKEELVNYLLSEFESDPKKIWESNIFGKSLHELVNEGLQNKLTRMPEDAQGKIQETLERIINEGSGGLICIIL